MFSDSNSFALFIDPGNSDSSDKGSKGVTFGAAIGAVAAAAIIAALIIFFVLKKKKIQIPTDDADVVGETESSITVGNNHQTMMDKDDPFAADFQNIELKINLIFFFFNL